MAFSNDRYLQQAEQYVGENDDEHLSLRLLGAIITLIDYLVCVDSNTAFCTFVTYAFF